MTCRPKQSTAILMSMTAPPAPLEVKDFDGQTIGTESLSLKVADPEVAKGLVHRYLVKVRNDMRQVQQFNSYPKYLQLNRAQLVLKREERSAAEAENPFLRRVAVGQEGAAIDPP